MNYVKQYVQLHEIPGGLKQTFHHEFTHTTSKDIILKMKHENKITDRDLKMVKFLYQFHFATPQQVFDYIRDETDETETVGALQARLDKLVHARVLNKFCLSPIKENRVYQDALTIYCLDFGGKYLLTNFSNEDLTEWFSSENFKTSELIAKDLMVVDFYLKLLKQTEGKITFFESSTPFQFEKTTLYPSFHFGLTIDGVLRYFIGEVAKDEDLPMFFRKKVEKYDQFLSTNAWKKYFFEQEPPILFVLTETDSLAQLCGQILDQVSSIQRYRLTTQPRLERPFTDLGAFLRYLPEQGKCQEVRIPIFDVQKLS